MLHDHKSYMLHVCSYMNANLEFTKPTKYEVTPVMLRKRGQKSHVIPIYPIRIENIYK